MDIRKKVLNTITVCRVVAEGLNLGKKISVPKDVMMEELNLPSNRGSRMFQERQRRVERYTLENSADGAHNVRNKDTEQSNTMTSIHQTDTLSR